MEKRISRQMLLHFALAAGLTLLALLAGAARAQTTSLLGASCDPPRALFGNGAHPSRCDTASLARP